MSEISVRFFHPPLLWHYILTSHCRRDYLLAEQNICFISPYTASPFITNIMPRLPTLSLFLAACLTTTAVTTAFVTPSSVQGTRPSVALSAKGDQWPPKVNYIKDPEIDNAGIAKALVRA